MLELIALLELYNTYDQKSIYYEVAKSILEKYNELDLSSIQGFSDSIHISTSTANRFIQQLYYQNFTVFQSYHNKSKNAYLYDGKYFPSTDEKSISYYDYINLTSTELVRMLSTIEENSLKEIANIITDKNECIFVGIPIHSAVWRLQTELVLMSKKTSAYVDPNHQVNAVEKSSKDSIVFALTYMRQDDDHTSRLLEAAQKRGATTISISNAPYFSDSNNPLYLSYSGTGTRLDSVAMESLLGYIGSLLRSFLIK